MYCGYTVRLTVSAIVRLDRAMTSSYRLPIATGRYLQLFDCNFECKVSVCSNHLCAPYYRTDTYSNVNCSVQYSNVNVVCTRLVTYFSFREQVIRLASTGNAISGGFFTVEVNK